MKNTLRNCLFGLGLALLVVSIASAQETFVKNGVAGVRGLQTHAVLPPSAIFSNCGSGCTSYNTGSGYYVSGTGNGDGPGQTLAVGFSAAKTTKFVKALTPNTNYTGAAGKISAYLLKGTATGGPTTKLVKLIQHGAIPDYPTIKVVHYTSKTTVTLKKGLTYYLCQTEPSAPVTMLWMLSNSDTTSPFWFQTADSCTAKGLTWLNATGATASAMEIN
ncbi:MAG TPA: hypothetical protein VNZ03_36170 [Terriglobales bacterium]|nr:hypothetical protein [Terriglobales bacterium]